MDWSVLVDQIRGVTGWINGRPRAAAFWPQPCSSGLWSSPAGGPVTSRLPLLLSFPGLAHWTPPGFPRCRGLSEHEAAPITVLLTATCKGREKRRGVSWLCQCVLPLKRLNFQTCGSWHGRRVWSTTGPQSSHPSRQSSSSSAERSVWSWRGGGCWWISHILGDRVVLRIHSNLGRRGLMFGGSLMNSNHHENLLLLLLYCQCRFRVPGAVWKVFPLWKAVRWHRSLWGTL